MKQFLYCKAPQLFPVGGYNMQHTHSPDHSTLTYKVFEQHSVGNTGPEEKG